MKIILKKDIKKLGFQYQEINVKPGYARNYLIPRGYAYLATSSAKKQLQEILKQRIKKEESLLKEAKKIANKLNNIELKIALKSSSNGKLFGSINNQTISKALVKYDIFLEKKFIYIPNNSIKTLGKHQAKIRLHSQLEISFYFEIFAIKDSK